SARPQALAAHGIANRRGHGPRKARAPGLHARGTAGPWKNPWPPEHKRKEFPMRPLFHTFLCLPPLALLAAALYLLARADLAGLDPDPLTEPWLTALDQRVGEEIWRADRRNELKRQVICALIDRRLTLLEAADRFRDIDGDRPDKAWDPRPPEWPGEEWARPR